MTGAPAAAVSATLAPACGPAEVATEVDATAAGFVPGSTVVWTYSGPGDQLVSGTALADANGEVTFTFLSSAGPPGSYLLRLSGSGPGGGSTGAVVVDPDTGATVTSLTVGTGTVPVEGSAPFAVPCDPITSSTSKTSTSTTLGRPGPGNLGLVCVPALGPPGFVTEAVGSGFPPNAQVTLAWQPGIGRVEVVSDAAGAFRTPMLVMHHDGLGPRRLTATLGGSVVGATPPSASAPFLVVPATLGPPRARDPRLVFRQ